MLDSLDFLGTGSSSCFLLLVLLLGAADVTDGTTVAVDWYPCNQFPPSAVAAPLSKFDIRAAMVRIKSSYWTFFFIALSVVVLVIVFNRTCNCMHNLV